jgi:geranylgeranyl diphosphate synthase type I
MTPTSARAVPALTGVAARVDAELLPFLADKRAASQTIAAGAAEPVEEIVRLVEAGGKRIRPAFCVWGYRAAGGTDDAVWQVAAALEMLHTMALLHDDVIDGDDVRRGEPTAHARQAIAAAARGQRNPQRVGTGVAIVAGDLAAAFAEELLSTSAFPDARLAVASERFHRMRLELAAGAYLHLAGADLDPALLARLKGGAYTVEGPLLIGAALAGADAGTEAAMRAYGAPLGQAFQMLDDLADDDAAAAVSRIDALAMVDAARAVLDSAPIDPAAADALGQLADLVGSL